MERSFDRGNLQKQFPLMALCSWSPKKPLATVISSWPRLQRVKKINLPYPETPRSKHFPALSNNLGICNSFQLNQACISHAHTLSAAQTTHSSQNSLNKWLKISSLEITIFDLNMMVESGLYFFILKFTEPLQRYLLTCQANSAFLGRLFCTVQQQF